jgi:hypothetical protein
MRLSDWQVSPRGQKVMTEKVAAAYGPAMAVLGTGSDPEAYVVWGDDPDHRYMILAIAEAGLVIVNVRVNVPQEGPRAAAKLVRWSRVQVGELSVEAHHGHRHVTSQVENSVLQGSDEDADEIGAFVAHLLAWIDGRHVGQLDQPAPAKPNRRSVPSGPIELPATTDRG